MWDALEEVIQDHPVLLNRAPTLHRLGIQAFQPMLDRGQGDQDPPARLRRPSTPTSTATRWPCTCRCRPKAQIESRAADARRRTTSCRRPHGRPLAVPSQDLVLGGYYLTKSPARRQGRGPHLLRLRRGRSWRYEPATSRRSTPIRVRYSGRTSTSTTQYDKQDIVARRGRGGRAAR